jgi:hypothetical protein
VARRNSCFLNLIFFRRDVRERLRSLVAKHQRRKPPTRAQLVRDHLTLEARPVRSLLSGLMVVPWEATPGELRVDEELH